MSWVVPVENIYNDGFGIEWYKDDNIPFKKGTKARRKTVCIQGKLVGSIYGE